jgi:hypothetical protein
LQIIQSSILWKVLSAEVSARASSSQACSKLSVKIDRYSAVIVVPGDRRVIINFDYASTIEVDGANLITGASYLRISLMVSGDFRRS